MALVELERVRALPGHDELDEEVGEGRVEELRQLGLEVVRGLADPDLRKTEGNGLFKGDLKRVDNLSWSRPDQLQGSSILDLLA